MTPKVSIIIPCYNQAIYLPKAIASLQSQTLEDWECIVVNDGSTDNTSEVAANIARQDNRVRLIQQVNGGLASARNTGLSQAKGEFIQFLDADDAIAPRKLEQQVATMKRGDSDISYTAFCFETNGQCSTPRFVRVNLIRLLVSWGLGASIPIHSFLYRNIFLQKNQLVFYPARREDWEWHIHCFSIRPRCATLPYLCGAIYYQNEEGMTGTYERMQKGNFEFMEYMTQRLSGWKKCMWALRVSEELWIWLLRMLKYRSTRIAASISIMYTQKGMLVTAILLMPIALIGVIRYYIQIYLAR